MSIFIASLFLMMAAAASISRKYGQLRSMMAPYWFMSWLGQTFAMPLALISLLLLLWQVLPWQAGQTPLQLLAPLLYFCATFLFMKLHLHSLSSGKALLSKIIGVEQAQQLKLPLSIGLLPSKGKTKQVKTLRNIAYGDDPKRHMLDIFLPQTATPKPMPILIQIHGGAWVIGNKEGQGQPLMNHIAANGWMGVTINYRLAPKNKFPAMIQDIYQAIAWVKEHAAEYGGDPSFIALTGGSAGGHLSALATLAIDNDDFRNGLSVDQVSVNAAVPIYGRYDFLDQTHILGKGRDAIMTFMREKVMSEMPDGDDSLLIAASPIYQLGQTCPPMLVLHGSHDSMLPPEEAEHFVQTAHQQGRDNIDLHIIDGAQHAFDIFTTPNTYYMVRAVTAYLDQRYALHQQ